MTFVHEDERVSAEDRRNRSELHRATTEDRRNRFELHLDGDERVTLFVENIPRRMQWRACGESHNMTLDAEKTSVLITTNYSGRINEIIQVEVGKDSFEVGVWELGFKDDAVDPLYQAEKKKMPVRSQLEDSSDSSSTSERVLSSGEKDNNSDRVCLLERAADLEKEVNLDGADRQLEENESCKGAGKGIAKKTWAEVLVDHRPTQSLSQTDSIPDLGPLSINMFSKTNAELEVWGGDLEPGLVGQHANKEIIQFEVVQSPKSIEVTGRVAELSSLDNFGELETIPSKIRSKNKVEDIQDSILSGGSLSDSDIRLKWEWARKDARSTLAFGKRIGLSIHGNEEEVVNELTLLEVQ
ncbi:hypothetical protein V6N12_005843 [Hibiscus sabdariffa]|uniref:Uncharacterized protein n=1 Tax=Hibiscus sabdariffa TaxID=183260 RepID=A0ABR2EW90_9ROSI